MTDILHRAWNVLELGERPEGLDVINTQWHDSLGRVLPEAIDPRVAYDRLVVAVSNANLRENSYETWDAENQTYHWQYAGDHPFASDRDRLTAAVLALESERGSDA